MITNRIYMITNTGFQGEKEAYLIESLIRWIPDSTNALTKSEVIFFFFFLLVFEGNIRM